jgi:hypothetical protein
MPISALYLKISTEAKASPAGKKMGLTVAGSIVIKKLTLASSIYKTAIAKTIIGVDLNIAGLVYK